MKPRIPLFFLLIIIACVAVLHMLGLYFKLYWRISWFDIIVHGLAAFWIAYAVFLAVADTFEIRTVTIISISVLFLTLVSAGWELFELKTGATLVSRPEYIPDTIGDIIADIIGGLAGVFIGIKRLSTYTQWNKEQN